MLLTTRKTERNPSKNEELFDNMQIRSSSSLIRLIDIHHLCVRSFKHSNPEDKEYIALSYVWGCNQKTKLLKENIDELGKSGSLASNDLPQTIRDAIEVAGLLGFSFLWVDALCIVQDDDDDKKLQIGRMSSIYGSAFLTIIAASGLDCNSGLPGLRPGSRSYEQREAMVIPPTAHQVGLSLLTTCHSYGGNLGEFHDPAMNDVDSSIWNSRGWTLQERALSRRNLIFTREQVLWACDGGYFCEESCLEHPDMEENSQARDEFSTPIRFGLFKVTLNPITMQSIDGQKAQMSCSRKLFWDKYRMLVRTLSLRKLSVPGDIHDAFQGMASALCRLSSEDFHWGHPLSRFELSLTWTSFHSLHRRQEKTTLKMTSIDERVEFPSWSWMGWKGEADLPVGDSRLET